MYKVGDLVIVTHFRWFPADEKSLKPIGVEQSGYDRQKVCTVTRLQDELKAPWDYLIDDLFWVREDQITLAKVVELPIYKALTEIEC